MLFLTVAALSVALLSIYQLRALIGIRKDQHRDDWDHLLNTVEKVNLEGIQAIADMFLNPTKDQLRLEPPDMWKMIGGHAGLRCMRKNADAMFQLCIFAERWNSEGIVIAQLIRTDAIKLRRAAFIIQLRLLLGVGEVRSHFALMEVAAYYDLMQRRLCGCYAACHAARLPQLQVRLGYNRAVEG